MRHAITSFILLGALAGPGAASAAVPQKAATAPQKATAAAAAKPAAKTSAAIHSVRGIVKSVDASSLVIARSGKKPSNLVFVLNQTTIQEGAPAVGENVSVRYRQEGKTLVATAVTAHGKQPAPHVSKAGK